MSVDDALSRMELVGHDFYLFADADSGEPSVVYRRKGYDYGVIQLGAVAPPDRVGGPHPAPDAGRSRRRADRRRIRRNADRPDGVERVAQRCGGRSCALRYPGSAASSCAAP